MLQLNRQTVRKRYAYKLNGLHTNLHILGTQTKTMLARALHSLRTGDTAIGHWVLRHHSDIDRRSAALEYHAARLLATQQPIVAFDWRLAMTTMAVTGAFARICNDAVLIAQRAPVAHACPLPDYLRTRLEHLGAASVHVLHTCVQASEQHDIELAYRLTDAYAHVQVLAEHLEAPLTTLLGSGDYPAAALLAYRDIVQALVRATLASTQSGERVMYLVTTHTESLVP